MFRLTIVSAFGLVAAIAANAGSIEIGGASGLTNNYITQGAGAVCAAGAGNCIAGSTGGYTEQNYDNVLFAGATNGTAPVPFTGYTQNTGIASGKTATSAAGTTFAMIADGTNGNAASNNFWESPGENGVTITVPIGIFDVTEVSTMLQNVWGTVGGNDTTVTFNFGTTSNAGTTTPVVVNLFNSNSQNGSSATGSIRSGVLCNTVSTATCNLTTQPGSAPVNTTTGLPSDVTAVDVSQVYGAPVTTTYAYSSVSPNSGFYANTQGHLRLDEQDFLFGSTYANEWLVSVQVTENVGDSDLSATALSAITVDTAAPEPTTILLVLAGLGGIGLAGRFRRA